METFGTWMKMERGSRSLVECARRAGMSSRQWQRLEKYARRPYRETIGRVAAALEVPVEEALRAAGYTTTPEEQGNDEQALRLGQRLDRILHELPADQRKKVEKQLEVDARQYADLLSPSVAEPGEA